MSRHQHTDPSATTPTTGAVPHDPAHPIVLTRARRLGFSTGTAKAAGPRGTPPRRIAWRRRATSAFVLLTIAALGLTGCGDSGISNDSSGAAPPNPGAARPGNGTGGYPGKANGPEPGDADGAFSTGAVTGSEVYAADQPLSTFGTDVDTASYGFTGEQLRADRVPDPATVRPEEFVNSFRQDYEAPNGNGFSVRIDGARLPDWHRLGPLPSGHREDAGRDGDRSAGEDATGGQSRARLLRVGLQTRPDASAKRPDAALTFVVDVSGSMGDPGKLDLVKSALRTLVDQLRPTDSVAIVAYSDTARTIREMTKASNRSSLHDAIDSLSTEGSTNLAAGLTRGYRVARSGFRPGITNRVILLSDGLPNVGDTDADDILKSVSEAANKQIALLGVGVGHDYGDAFMERLADRGNGFVVYVSSPAQARHVFVDQLPATLTVRALDAKVQVNFDRAAVLTYRLIGYEDRALPASAFRDDSADGGEVGPGHSVTALYVVRLRADAAPGAQIARAQVRWLDPATRRASEATHTVTTTDVDTVFALAPPRLRTDYVAAFFAERLRRSGHGTEVSWDRLAEVADGAATQTEDQDVTALADLVRRASRLSP